MGGPGSGCRWNTKPTLDEQLRVDIHWLKRENWLIPGTSSRLCWTSYGEESGSVDYRNLGDKVVFSYSHSIGGRLPEDVERTVRLQHTPCRFGGSRPWFTCPFCQRRSGIMVIRGPEVACRRCIGLPYACQQESKTDQASRRLRKIQRRLGNPEWENVLEPWFPRPKGMHRKTHERIVQQAEKPVRVIERQMVKGGFGYMLDSEPLAGKA